MIRSETEVAIVGAGPTGLALAATLAARGVTFALFDRLAEGENTSRAAAVHARTLEVLEPLGVSERMIAEGNKMPAFTMRDRDHELLRIDFSKLHTAYPYVLALPQNRTEAILSRRLEELGGEAHRGWEAVELAQTDDAATVTFRGPDSATSAVRARYVVGCDGMHSRIREQCGIGFETGTYAEGFVLGDVRLSWPYPEDEGQLFLSPAGMMVAAPFGPGHIRMVATVQDAPPNPSREDLQALLDERGPTGGAAKISEALWSSRFRVHHGVAARYREGRAFVAGDAAHVHSPAGGQGMNTGIQDACRLGEILANVLRGRADDASLSRYETERRPIAQGVVSTTDRLTRLATMQGPIRQRLRNAAIEAFGHIPALRAMIARQMAELPTRA